MYTHTCNMMIQILFAGDLWPTQYCYCYCYC